MTIDIDKVLDGLGFRASDVWRELPETLRCDKAIWKVALERAAAVAYYRVFDEFCGFLTDDMHGVPELEYDDPVLVSAAKYLAVSPTHLQLWTSLVDGWEQREWFYVLFLATATEGPFSRFKDDGR